MPPILKRTILITGLLVFVSQSLQASDEQWEAVKNENSIKISSRLIDLEGVHLREFRGELTVDASLDTILAVFYDIDRYPDWYHRCDMAMILDKPNAVERYHYQNITIPFPFSNRGLLIHSLVSLQGEAVSIHSVIAPSYCEKSPMAVAQCTSIAEKNDFLVTHFRSHYLFTPRQDGGVNIVWQYAIDLGLPIRPDNEIANVQYQTLNALRSQVKKDPYKTAKLKRDKNGHILGIDLNP